MVKEKKEKKIGKITHYFTKIEVGIIKLTSSLVVGEIIHIKGHTTDFEQTVESIQINHKEVKKAGKGKEIGFKADEPVREGDEVFKVPVKWFEKITEQIFL